jgi:toxin ParE1/3/4
VRELIRKDQDRLKLRGLLLEGATSAPTKPVEAFYVERSDHVDVWRVLHGMRDIPSWMQDPDLI